MTDTFRKYASLFSTTSSSFGTGSDVDITLNSATGLPTDTDITLTFDRVDANGAATTLMERIIGTVSGVTFAVKERGADGTTERAHTTPVVEMVWNAKDLNDTVDGVLVEHNQDGTHGDITASNVDVSNLTASNVDVSNLTASNINISDTVEIDGILDEDTMASDSATKLATQQSIKAYTDNGTYLKDSLARQAIINGNFDIWQRGVTTTGIASSGFIADRWHIIYGVDGGTFPTNINRRATLTSGAINNAYYSYQVNVDGAGSSLGNGSYYWLRQKIEFGTRYLCGDGKKVTVSFWAKSDIANKKIGLYLQQDYGSGGSPSTLEIINGTNWTLTSTWTKYTHTFTTNTLASKTFGTANDDHLIVGFMYTWGSTYQDRAGASSAEDFVGAGNIDIAQVQLCTGEVALPFMAKSYAQELLDCQRYCFVKSVAGYEYIGSGWAVSTTAAAISVPLPVEMRIIPTLTAEAADFSLLDRVSDAVNCTAIAMDGAVDNKYAVNIQATVAEGLTQFRPYNLSGDNGGTRLIVFSAEL